MRQFSLQFARLSPYAVIEILGLSDAQQERFLKAYDIAKTVMRELGIFPAKGDADQERIAMELDEFERGYPRLTLSLMMDVVGACLATVENDDDRPTQPGVAVKRGAGHPSATHPGRANSEACGLVARAARAPCAAAAAFRVFDPPSGATTAALQGTAGPRPVSIIDLSDSGASELNNIVIADLLRGRQEAQDDAYEAYERAIARGSRRTRRHRVLLVIEEAHEFLSSERIDKMPILFEQVARIAKRGRKRWLGLVFVTQLPQHLPRQIFGLVNSYILHKITDPQIVCTLSDRERHRREPVEAAAGTGAWSGDRVVPAYDAALAGRDGPDSR